MKIFMFEIKWNQSIRDFIAHDESRITGYRRVMSRMNVVSDDSDRASELVRNRFKHYEPTVELMATYPVHAFIEPAVIRDFEQFKVNEIIGKEIKL